MAQPRDKRYPITKLSVLYAKQNHGSDCIFRLHADICFYRCACRAQDVSRPLLCVNRRISSYLNKICTFGTCSAGLEWGSWRDCFFITSGYVITHVLQSEKTTEFLIKRFFRIYPLFIFAVICEAVVNKLVNGVPFPPAWQWIPHLLLLGDLVGIPTSLSGVEWTLRIEVAFYVLMAIFKSSGLMRSQQYLPTVFAILAAVLYFSPPFPNSPGLTLGYTTLYAPFLFVGSCVYLLEMRKANKNVCIAVMISIVFAFWTMTTKVQPVFNNNNHSMYALIVFFGGWLIRGKMQDGPLIRLASSLTYSVYLFHNWIWRYLMDLLPKIGLTAIPLKMQVTAVLLLLCYGSHKTVEDYGLHAGRVAIKYYRTFKVRATNKQSEAAAV